MNETREFVEGRKVLSVVDGSGWTGGVEQTLLLSRELRSRGVDARMAAHASNPVLAEAAGIGVPAYPYDKGGGAMKAVRSLRAVLAPGYDIVVGHKPGAVRHLFLARMLSTRRPVFIGVRRVCYPVSRLTVYRTTQMVVAVAEEVGKVLRRSGLKPDRIRVIPSGVDLSRFFPSETARRRARRELGIGGETVLLNLAKFVPGQKGQRHLFEALCALKETGPVKVLLAGLETDGVEAREMVRHYGLVGQVTLLGFRRDIPELINAADLFVFPSLPGLDAIAGSVLQAMACAKVTVASDVGGIPEYLRDGENGFLVKPGDSAALAGRLLEAMRMGKEARGRMGESARSTVVRSYSTEAMAGAWIDLMGELSPPPEG